MEKRFEQIATLFAWLSAMTLTGIVLLIVGYVIYNGYSAINTELFFGYTDPLKALLFKQQVTEGIFPAIIGTFTLVLISVFIALPLGILSGVYMAEYANGHSKKVFSLFFDILSSVPSIVIGLFGFSITIFLHHYFSQAIFPCLLISAISLGFLVLPYIIRSTQLSLEQTPKNIRGIAPALGASKLQNILYVLLPSSFSGIISGVVLAIGRCAEDTAVIMLTGAVASAGIPKSLFQSYEALPFFIYYISSQYADQEELKQGYSAAIILLGICVSLFILSFVIKNILHKRVTC